MLEDFIASRLNKEFYDFTQEARFPAQVQPIAEAIVMDLASEGSHLTRTMVGMLPQLAMDSAGLLEKLHVIKESVQADQGFQPSATDLSDLHEWVARLQKAIPEDRKHLCFREIQALELPQKETPPASLGFVSVSGGPKTEAPSGVMIGDQWAGAGSAVLMRRIGMPDCDAIVSPQGGHDDLFVRVEFPEPPKGYEKGVPYSVSRSSVKLPPRDVA